MRTLDRDRDRVDVLDVRPVLAAVLALHDAPDLRALAAALPVVVADLVPYDSIELVGELAGARAVVSREPHLHRLVVRTVPANRILVGVVLGRYRAFTRWEADVAGLLGPHLGAAVDHAHLRAAHPVAATRAAVAALTVREQEVLALVADGHRDRDIAVTLHIEPRTVEKHVEHIRTKLGARSRAEAVARWARAFD